MAVGGGCLCEGQRLGRKGRGEARVNDGECVWVEWLSFCSMVGWLSFCNISQPNWWCLLCHMLCRMLRRVVLCRVTTNQFHSYELDHRALGFTKAKEMIT